MKKTALIFAFILLASVCFAGEKDLTFEWNQEIITEDFAGWKLYMSETSGTYTATPFATIAYGGTELTDYTTDQKIELSDGEEKTMYFVLTAYDTNGNESDYSNEVSAVIDFKAPGVPFTLKVSVVTP